MRGWCWRFAMAAVAGHERGGNQHTAFLRCLAHRLTSVQAVHGMWRTEGPSPALYYLAQLEEPSVSVDVLRTVHAASMAVVPVDASEGFPLCLPAYPFAEDKEGHCEAAGDGVPGVAWVEHHAACLLALLASPYADHALVGVHGTAVLARRVAPLLRAHGTTPKSEHGSSAFAALEAQASFVLVHLRVLEAGLSGVGKCGDSAFKRRGAEASKALAAALAATSIAK